MDRQKNLRGFRMDRDKEKGQTSMLRYVRQGNSPRQYFTTKATPEISQNSVDSTTPDSSGSSSSPNQLNVQPPLPQSSKLIYVKPLSEEEQDMGDAKESGFDTTTVLRHSNSLNGNHSDDSNHTDNSNDFNQDNGVSSVNHVNKRMRIESDDENCTERVVKRPCLSDDENSCDENTNSTVTPNTTKFSPEMIEKLLDTYNDLYPSIDRMELFDVMEKWDYNFSEMTKSLDSMVKEQKAKQKERSKALGIEEKRKLKIEEREKGMEERRRARIEERDKVKKQKQADIKKKKVIWKMKARFHDQEHDEEEEEDYIGKSKVYESDSSEEDGEREDDEEEVVTPARNMVLEFFNDCPNSELSTLPSCSKKKADVILSMRPFENWRDLVYKFKTGKHLSTDLLNNAKDVLQMRNAIKNLMKKCEKISSEIQTFVTEVIDDGTSGMSEQPKILSPEMTLKPYQLIGLNWLVLMHDQQLNGVLADEMGLGKTVQAISFLGYLKERGELDGRMCLIVVPTSTLDNWARELTTWLPSMGFLTYHGSQEERKGMRLDILNDELDEDVGVILTTYNMVTSSAEDKALFKRLALHTIIYDEAHMLKNMTSQRYENLMKIRCVRRLLLTGTPLQNNLVELMSILIFVMPQLFEGRKEELKKVFSMFPKNESDDNKGRYETERIQQAKRIMAPFFLRRLKEDVLKDLPKKSDEVFYVPMNERQDKIYTNTVQVLSKRAEEIKEELEKTKLKDLEEFTDLPLVRNASTSKTAKKIQPCEDSSSNMLMKLRKLANHPLLLRNLFTDEKIKEMSKILKKTTHKEAILDYIIEDFSVMSDFEIHQTCKTLQPISKFKLDPDVIVKSGKMEKLDQMLPEMKKNGDRVLIFSQFVIVLNLLEEYMKIRGYSYKRLDGSTQVVERQEMIDDFNEDDNIFIFLLSTRAGGLGINLSAANTVILHDIDFNPYNDKQAEDRCHRVGQTRNVKVYRYISKDSIEEGMYQIACNKLQLEKDVTGKNEDHRKSDVVALLKTALRVNNPDPE